MAAAAGTTVVGIGGQHIQLQNGTTLAEILQMVHDEENKIERLQASIHKQRETARRNTAYGDAPNLPQLAANHGYDYDNAWERYLFLYGPDFDYINYITPLMRSLINEHLTGLNQDPIQHNHQLCIIPNNLMNAQGIPNPGKLSVYVMCKRNSECYKLTLQRSHQRIKVYKMEPYFANTKEDRLRLRFSSKTKRNGRSISVALLSMLVFTNKTSPDQYLTIDGLLVDETVDHKDGYVCVAAYSFASSIFLFLHYESFIVFTQEPDEQFIGQSPMVHSQSTGS